MINLQEALAYEFPEVETRYDERDLALYALGIGAAKDPLDEKELRFVWEGHPRFTSFPTYGVVSAVGILMSRATSRNRIPGLPFDLGRILHVAQYMQLHNPLPRRAVLKNRVRIETIDDEPKNAVVEFRIDSFDESGTALVSNKTTVVIRGAGRGVRSGMRRLAKQAGDSQAAPDLILKERVPDNQALLYRLSGDRNPLHVDPDAARNLGLQKPILHGVCTLGYVSRMLMKELTCGEFKSIQAHFSHAFYPGETLETRIWKISNSGFRFCSIAVERQKKVLSGGELELQEVIPNP